MKNFIRIRLGWTYLLALMILLVGASCSDLDLKPQGALTDTQIGSSTSNMESLLLGVYAMLDEYHSGSDGSAWFSSPTNWQYGDVPSDDAYKGSNVGDQTPLLEMEEFVHNPTNVYFNVRWKVLYEGVSRANQFIKILNTSTAVSDERKKTMLAEVRFLRAHYYFQLYRTFKNVPYIDETTTDILASNTVDVLPKIIADFEFAKANLPENRTELGRPTMYAAAAYLGKVYLYKADYTSTAYLANKNADGSDFDPTAGRSDFQKAKAEFDQVVGSGKYTLMSEFMDIYDPAKKLQNTEAIFSVVHSVKDGAPTGENGDLGSLLNFVQGGPGGTDNNGCCGFYVPSENLANAYKTFGGLPRDAFTGRPFGEFNDDAATGGNMSDFGKNSTDPFTPYAGELDPRLDFTVGRRGIPFLDYTDHPGANWSREPKDQGNYSRKKRYISKSGFSAGYGDKPTWYVVTAIDFHVIRYADVLLMLAECEVELDQLSRAQQLVDMVRQRAKNSTYLKKGTTNAALYNIELYGVGHSAFATKEKARQAVRFERRLEMALEGSRFFDLVRWGIAQSVINTYAQGEPVSYASKIKFQSGKHEFFPIPQTQIDLSQKNGSSTLTQNKGY